jgi:hypothetical protein
MQQRVPLLLVTGALAFGSLGYFLFLWDDGSMPTKNSPLHPIAHRPKPTGAGANSAAVPSTTAPVSMPPLQIATTPAPATTGPPE